MASRGRLAFPTSEPTQAPDVHRKGCPLDPRASPSAQGLTQLPAYQGKDTRTRPVLGLRHMACGHLVTGLFDVLFSNGLRRQSSGVQPQVVHGCASVRRWSTHGPTGPSTGLPCGRVSCPSEQWTKHTRARCIRPLPGPRRAPTLRSKVLGEHFGHTSCAKRAKMAG